MRRSVHPIISYLQNYRRDNNIDPKTIPLLFIRSLNYIQYNNFNMIIK